METLKKDDSYSHILKYTGVFGGVQGLNILISVVRNKFTALFIGAGGLGLLSLFNSTINMIVAACNFGIPTSGVQELSDKYSASSQKISDSVMLIRSWSLITALLGAVVCVVIGPLLDLWSFAWGNHTLHFILLSPAVAFTIVTGGELAILKATRQLRALAVSSFFTVVSSLLISVPIYYVWSYRGIVPVLVGLVLVQMMLTLHYSNRYYPYCVKMSAKFLRRGVHVIRLGMAFVIAGLLNTGAEFFVRTFINNRGDLEHVGYFNAGWTLAIVYAGLIFTAMESDYFPRLSAIKDNSRDMSQCVSKQMEMNVLMVGPILTIMLFCLPVLIPLLYDSSFLVMLPLTQFAMLSMLFKAMYLPIEYIPLAKGRSWLFLCQEAFAVFLLVALEMWGYASMGLVGIGAGISLAYLLETVAVLVFSRIYFSYRASRNVWLFAGIQVFFVGVSLFAVTSGLSTWMYCILAVVLSLLNVGFTLYLLKTKTEVFDMLAAKMNGKR